MIRQETTYHPNFQIASFKEYHENTLVIDEYYDEKGFRDVKKYDEKGKLVLHQIYKNYGNTPFYQYRVSEYETFWFEYKYDNEGKLVSFWNSHGQFITYNDGIVSSMKTIKLFSGYFPIKLH